MFLKQENYIDDRGYEIEIKYYGSITEGGEEIVSATVKTETPPQDILEQQIEEENAFRNAIIDEYTLELIEGGIL